MKKFSDKVLREEIAGLREQVRSFPDIRMRPVGMLLHADMIEFLMKQRDEREAQVVQREREAARGLVEALEAFEFKQYQGRDEKPIGWLMLRPSVSKNRGGVNVTFQEPEMLEALQNWYNERSKALATYNDNRKG